MQILNFSNCLFKKQKQVKLWILIVLESSGELQEDGTFFFFPTDFLNQLLKQLDLKSRVFESVFCYIGEAGIGTRERGSSALVTQFFYETVVI